MHWPSASMMKGSPKASFGIVVGVCRPLIYGQTSRVQLPSGFLTQPCGKGPWPNSEWLLQTGGGAATVVVVAAAGVSGAEVVTACGTVTVGDDAGGAGALGVGVVVVSVVVWTVVAGGVGA